MSFDLHLWKFKPSPRMTPGLIFLLLGEGIDTPDVEPLPIRRLRAEIDAAFPGWDGEEVRRWALECSFQESHICISTHGSTPASVIDWFLAMAEREGLTVFDPQQTGCVTKEDEAALDKALQLQEASKAASGIDGVRERAEAGDADAQFLLGNAYAFGEGVPTDQAEAVRWFLRSAEQGQADAMFNLAACYRQGDGLPKDIARAISWYERAAQKDPLNAAFELGEIYETGEGVPADPARAIEWYRISLEHRHPSAKRRIKRLGGDRGSSS